jgi:methylglyoxal synthase
MKKDISAENRLPRLAIIAHDGKKADLVAFATFNRDRLQQCRLIGTSTTARMLREKVGLPIDSVESGPHGGDVQIANLVVEGKIDAVLFIVDPLDKSIRTTRISRRCCASATCATFPWPPTSPPRIT